MKNYEEALRAAREQDEPGELAVGRLVRRAGATLDRPGPSRRPLFAGVAVAGLAAAALLVSLTAERADSTSRISASVETSTAERVAADAKPGSTAESPAASRSGDTGATTPSPTGATTLGPTGATTLGPTTTLSPTAVATLSPTAATAPTGALGPTGATPFGPTTAPTAETAPTGVTTPLASDAPTTLALSKDVVLSYSGLGEATLDPAHPRVQWELGTLDVEVTPDRGVDLVIETPEATVRVVGTGFTVARDALGSAVGVRHGIVAVRCGDGRERRLTAGQSMTCLPKRAAGMLARAKALAAGGASDADVLVALDAGLRLETNAPVRAELSARRIRTLSALGRDEEAAAAAAAWLASGESLRREEVQTLALTVALRRGDCRTATELARARSLSVEQAAVLARCTP